MDILNIESFFKSYVVANDVDSGGLRNKANLVHCTNILIPTFISVINSRWGESEYRYILQCVG